MTAGTLDRIAQALESAVAVPSIPAAVVRLLSLLGSPDHTREEVVRVVRSDPGLVSEVLRVANSAAHSRGGPAVGTANEAVGRLGEQWLLKAVMARAMSVLRVANLEGYHLGVQALWAHAIRVAVAAEKIAPRAEVPPDLAWTAGLLVDIGKLATSSFLLDLQGSVRDALAGGSPVPFDLLERMLLGVDHAELGARIAETWGVPDSLVAAIRFHHHPHDAVDHQALCQVVHAADTLAYLTGHGLGIDGLLYRATSEPLPSLVFDEADVDRLLAEIEVGARAIEAMVAA
jgi:putative nucleotidyltransferase with HDIG domain